MAVVFTFWVRTLDKEPISTVTGSNQLKKHTSLTYAIVLTYFLSPELK